MSTTTWVSHISVCHNSALLNFLLFVVNFWPCIFLWETNPKDDVSQNETSNEMSTPEIAHGESTHLAGPGILLRMLNTSTYGRQGNCFSPEWMRNLCWQFSLHFGLIVVHCSVCICLFDTKRLCCLVVFLVFDVNAIHSYFTLDICF